MVIFCSISILIIAFLTACLPYLAVWSSQPIISIVNESVAWVGWCFFVGWVVVVREFKWSLPLRKPEAAPVWILGVLFIFVVIGVWLERSPYPMSILIYLSYIILAGLVFFAAYNLAQSEFLVNKFLEIFAVAWILSALVSVGIGFYQYFNNGGFLPWIAALRDPGRIYANLRQPNHFASFLCCAIPLVSWLAIERRIINAVLLFCSLIFVSVGVAMSGSRTGLVSLVIVSAILFVFYRKRDIKESWIFLLLPIIYFIAASIFAWVNEIKLYPYFASERIQTMGENYSGSRLDMWLITLEMIGAYPLFGVGVGRYTFFYFLGNWSIPGVLRFEHAHNIFLQWAVENGLIAFLILATCVVVYMVKLFSSRKNHLSILSAIFIAPLLVHSMFEFPLWYSFFLFPCMFFLGLISQSMHIGSVGDRLVDVKLIALISCALLVSCLIVFSSHQKLERMYLKSDDPIDARISHAQQSLFFRQHVDHALLISLSPDIVYSNMAQSIYQSTAQLLLDERLVYQWAIQSLLSNEMNRAKKLAYVLHNLNLELFQIFRERAAQITPAEVSEIKDFLKYLQHPTPINLKPEDLINP